MKKKKTEEFKLSIEKLHKYAISYEQFFSDLTPEEQEWVEREARYYILLQDIRKQRKAKGLTQQQLATKVNMPRTMITKIESGNRNVTVDTLMQIAQAMGKKLVVGLE
jgi:ribosome-binding protein aMBF1 (putative translation factor)